MWQQARLKQWVMRRIDRMRSVYRLHELLTANKDLSDAAMV